MWGRGRPAATERPPNLDRRRPRADPAAVRFQRDAGSSAHSEPKPADPNRPVCDHGLTHFSFEVDDVQAVYERLKAAGMRFHCPPQKLGELGTATYGRDPDGNAIELQGP